MNHADRDAMYGMNVMVAEGASCREIMYFDFRNMFVWIAGGRKKKKLRGSHISMSSLRQVILAFKATR